MNRRFLFTLFAVAVPLAAGYGSTSSGGYGTAPGAGYGAGGASSSYGPAAGGGSSISYLPSSASNGLDELVHAANGGPSITGNGEIQPSHAETARLSQVQAQLQALNANPTYRNLKNSDAIAESLAESNLASNIRQGNINVVAPNVVDQGVYRSLLVPSGQNNHQVIATQPLPPIIVNQPALPPTTISGGPAAIVKAAPVIYKIKPSVIYQQEVINKVPTPLSLNPVYVKVYKPGKKVDAPVAPVVQPAYQQASYGAAPSYGSNAGGYGSNAGGYGSNAGGYGSNAGGYGSHDGGYGSHAGGATDGGYGGAPTYNSPSPAGYGGGAQGY